MDDAPHPAPAPDQPDGCPDLAPPGTKLHIAVPPGVLEQDHVVTREPGKATSATNPVASFSRHCSTTPSGNGLTEAPYRSGDFVWSNYPERENPARPGPRHIGYVALSTGSVSGGLVVLAYTTSQPWTGSRPLGVFCFDRSQAAGMGQSRPFTLDLRRMMFAPGNRRMVPGPGAARPWHRRRHAPESLRVELETAARDLARRRPELIEHLGPLRPRPRG